MRQSKNAAIVHYFLFGGFLVVFSLAFLRVHMRVQTTLIGYELGKLKKTESKMLEEKSNLQMMLAKLSTKQHLSLMASSSETGLITEVAENSP